LQMIQDLTQLDRDASSVLLESSGKSVKVALLMHWTKVDRDRAEAILVENQGQLRPAMESGL
jgi:N-acetylmuramic acid 6-phosphate etherase